METGRSNVTGARGATVCSASLPSPVSTVAIVRASRGQMRGERRGDSSRAEQSRSGSEWEGERSAGRGQILRDVHS